MIRSGLAPLLGLLLVAAALAHAAPPTGKTPVIGILIAGIQPHGFRDGLRELGYVEGRNITIVERASGGHNGLLAYGTHWPDVWRRAAGYVDRVLKGARPGELPVEQPTRFELVLNLRTARSLGLTIPPSFLARVDQAIE